MYLLLLLFIIITTTIYIYFVFFRKVVYNFNIVYLWVIYQNHCWIMIMNFNSGAWLMST